MPVQTQMSSFAKKMGGRVAEANAEHKDKPIDTGMMQLPPGIKDGIAKLRAMYTNEYSDDKNGPGTKGQIFFRASAVIMSPEEHNGRKVAGAVTSVVIPLCDMPAKGLRKAKKFSDNWFEFQNLFKLLGIAPPSENQQTDPTGVKTEQYYFAAMKTLTAQGRAPVYISFSTRGWTPTATPQKPKPEEMVFEEWHGLAEFNGQHDPGAKMTEAPPATQPAPNTPPPSNTTFAEPQTAAQQGAAPPPTTGAPPQYQPGGDPDPVDIVTSLVEIILNDPDPNTPTQEGAAAQRKLEDMAWAAGATKDQTKNANDWAEVGEMALGMVPASAPPTQEGPIPAVGSKYKFAKRTKDGGRLTNAKGEVFPPQDVEVTSVDAANKTCTVKSAKDGKDVVDIRSKKPVAVKFEWLE